MKIFMRGKKLAATLALTVLLFTGCGLKDQNAIIKINDKAITQSEFNQLMDKQISQSPFAKMGDIKGNKDGFMYLMTEQRVVSQLIIQELLSQEAQKRGIKVTNKDLDQAIKKVMDKIGGRDRLSEVLKQNGVSIGEFKKDLKNQVMMQKLANSTGGIKVSDSDCKAFYNKNINKFQHKDQVRASHILIAANPYQIQQDIVDGSKFPKYAKKYSEDPNSAQQGGDLGFFAKDAMVPEFSKAAFTARPNRVLDPVKTQFGYHIIIVTDRKAAGVVPYEKAKSDIKEYLTNEKQIKALDDLTQAAKKKSKIVFVDKQYDPDVINAKLHKQVNEMSNGAADREQNNKKK